MIRLAAITSHLNGTLPKDAQTKRWAKMWFKEWMTYAVFPNFTVNEYKRYEPFAPKASWVYAAFAHWRDDHRPPIFSHATAIPSLYNFSTSSGFVFPGNSAANTQAAGARTENATESCSAPCVVRQPSRDRLAGLDRPPTIPRFAATSITSFSPWIT